jgi:hypothetical protein
MIIQLIMRNECARVQAAVFTAFAKAVYAVGVKKY